MELQRLREVETVYTAISNEMKQLQNSYSDAKNELSRLQVCECFIFIAH